MPTPWARYVKDVTAAAASQKDIAAASGVTPSVLSRWLSGRCRRPSAEQAIKLAQAYGRPPMEALVAAGYLVGQSGDEPPGVRTLAELSDQELICEAERQVAGVNRIWAEVSKRYFPTQPS
jgi:transcriptional regulator with XRE-family HTH domain